MPMEKGKGRRKIEIKRIEDKRRSQVTFAKRRQNLFKKANELDTLCGSETAVVSVSSTGKVYSAGRPSLLQRVLVDSLDWNELDDLRRAIDSAMSNKNKNKEPALDPAPVSSVADPNVATGSSSPVVVCIEEPGLSFEELYDDINDFGRCFFESLGPIVGDDGSDSWSLENVVLDDPLYT